LSHSRERAEKICLNCHTELQGRYCHVCGQENIEPRQTAWHLVTHFFSDVTHFDGKFFTTVRDLFAKPGFLSGEYIRGRRISYLDPVRMYIFTSAIFFIIFFSLVNVRGLKAGPGNGKIQVHVSRGQLLENSLKAAKTHDDSVEIEKVFSQENVNAVKPFTDEIPGQDSPEYKTTREFDSVQASLPPSGRMGWFRRMVRRKEVDLNERFRADRRGLIVEGIEIFVHNFPKLLFISLPLFALQLQLLYIRRKQFYYVDHGIFGLHLYIFSFLALLVEIGLYKLRKLSGWHWVGWLEAILFFFAFSYYYRAMKNFYGQGRAKTILKFLLTCVTSTVIMLTLFVIFIVFSVFEM
jgi:Protein of unknown function (DUF3667)